MKPDVKLDQELTPEQVIDLVASQLATILWQQGKWMLKQKKDEDSKK